MLGLRAASRKRDRDSPSIARSLSKLAASPWAISFISFALTALVIRLPGITLV
jgi:hypothetical protein